MKNLIKYSAYGVGGLMALILVGVGIFAATFNPNDYKALIIKTVQEKKQRTLTIDGDIKLAFWPKLGVDLGKVAISEHKGSKEFAGVDSAKVFLAVMPLLKKELVVDTVKVDGVRANIVRFKDGTTNFDDLLSKDEEESQEVKFDVDGVQVTNAAVTLTDEMGNRHFKFDNMQLTTGHIAKNEPIKLDASLHAVGDNPKMDANIQLKGTLLADAEKKIFGAKGLDAAIQGSVDSISKLDLKVSGDVDAKPEVGEFMVDGLTLVVKADMQGKELSLNLTAPKVVAKQDEVSGKKVNVELTSKEGDDNITAKLTLADLKGSPKAFESSGISGDISGKQGARSLAGKFSSPFKGNLETMVFDLPKFAGNVDIKDPALPNGAAKLGFNVNAHVEAKKELANVNLSANIDGSNIKGDVGVVGFKQANVKFNLTADKLDLNKLLGAQKPSKPSTPATKPADLSALKTVLAQGSINIGSLLYDKYKVSNLVATIHADGKTLSVSPFSLKLDDSNIKGALGITQFERALYTFDLDIDQLDADRYASADSGAKAKDSGKPADLSGLKALNANGKLRIGSFKYGKTRASNINIEVKADGQKLEANPLSAKVDDSQISGRVGIAQFSNPTYLFDLNIDKLDVNRYMSPAAPSGNKEASSGGGGLSALKTLRADGQLKIGQVKYDKVNIAGFKAGLKADGQKLSLAPFQAKIDDSNVDASLGITRFDAPIYQFKVAIDKLDADRYIAKGAAKSQDAGDAPIDLSALKTLNATGEARVGWLKLANVKTSNVRLDLKAEGGQVALAPFAADLYQGSMNGSLNVDARTIPAISFKQDMKSIAIGPLLVDAINNDMLEGNGTVNIDVKTQGATVGALKRGLNGNAALNLADGAVKGIDIAGTIRDMKSKLDIFKNKNSVDGDDKKKTDFSELTATFDIKNGVARNEDLAMKAPILRLAKGDSRGDIDIGAEKINYLAKPTIVKSLKGQGGADLDSLAGFGIPVKITGTFANPKFGMDFAAIGSALAKSNLLDKVGGEKGAAAGKLLGGDVAGGLGSLLGGKKAAETAPAQGTGAEAAPAPAPAEEPKSIEDKAKEKAKKKLNKLLGL